MQILVIEDDLKLLRLYSKVLQSAGHKVTQAATIHAAQTILSQNDFDVCVCDMHIGYHTGMEILGQFPTLLARGVRLLVISGQDKHRAACEAIGVDYYLKPVTNAELIAAVEGTDI